MKPEQLVQDNKFLDDFKELALANKGVSVPLGRPDLYVAKMWAAALLMVLNKYGYEIRKKE